MADSDKDEGDGDPFVAAAHYHRKAMGHLTTAQRAIDDASDHLDHINRVLTNLGAKVPTPQPRPRAATRADNADKAGGPQTAFYGKDE